MRSDPPSLNNVDSPGPLKIKNTNILYGIIHGTTALNSLKYVDCGWLLLANFASFMAIGMQQLTRAWLISETHKRFPTCSDICYHGIRPADDCCIPAWRCTCRQISKAQVDDYQSGVILCFSPCTCYTRLYRPYQVLAPYRNRCFQWLCGSRQHAEQTIHYFRYCS